MQKNWDITQQFIFIQPDINKKYFPYFLWVLLRVLKVDFVDCVKYLFLIGREKVLDLLQREKNINDDVGVYERPKNSFHDFNDQQIGKCVKVLRFLPDNTTFSKLFTFSRHFFIISLQSFCWFL